jgi:hypothetical protein
VSIVHHGTWSHVSSSESVWHLAAILDLLPESYTLDCWVMFVRVDEITFAMIDQTNA